MQPCRVARKSFTAYLDQELTPRKTRWVEWHLQTCEVCRKELEELHRMTLLLRSLPGPSRPEAYWPLTLQNLRWKIQGLPRPPRFPLFQRFRGLLESPSQVLVPATLFFVALLNSLAVLDLEEEALVFFASYLFPFILG